MIWSKYLLYIIKWKLMSCVRINTPENTHHTKCATIIIWHKFQKYPQLCSKTIILPLRGDLWAVHGGIGGQLISKRINDDENYECLTWTEAEWHLCCSFDTIKNHTNSVTLSIRISKSKTRYWELRWPRTDDYSSRFHSFAGKIGTASR